MRLGDLLEGIEHQILRGEYDIEISGVEYDSRRVAPGSAFVCVAGFKTDGHNYVSQAVLSGAGAIISERAVETDGKCAVVLVRDARRVLSVLAARIFDHPTRSLRVVGVTGTNGKTTITHLIKAILEEAGHKVGLMGTLYASFQDYQESFANTTPESVDIERFCRKVLDGKGEYVVMEVSSHALDLGRVNQIDFDVAVFSNLTQDHLDYHKTLDNYREAKSLLFKNLELKIDKYAVINLDDDHAPAFIQAAGVEKITFGITQTAIVKAVDAEISAGGSTFLVVYPDGELKINLRLAGLFSVYNALAAITFALREGIAPNIIQMALSKVKVVPGRFESIDEGQDFTVIVDYAHTPDGLENILKTARQIAKGRIITVFGCGGDRDRTKRPLMGGIAGRYSDFCIVTSDNPRSEEPLDIIEDILSGLREVNTAHYAVVPDRREAIRHAVYLGKTDDFVIIAGKGHENYQLIKGKTYPFDDRLVTREYIREKERNASHTE